MKAKQRTNAEIQQLSPVFEYDKIKKTKEITAHLNSLKIGQKIIATLASEVSGVPIHAVRSLLKTLSCQGMVEKNYKHCGYGRYKVSHSRGVYVKKRNLTESEVLEASKYRTFIS